MENNSETGKLWSSALQGLDPRIQEALNRLAIGQITQADYEKVHTDVYRPTDRQQVLGKATEATFQQFFNGDITKEQLDDFVDTLNNNPDTILPGKNNTGE